MAWQCQENVNDITLELCECVQIYTLLLLNVLHCLIGQEGLDVCQPLAMDDGIIYGPNQIGHQCIGEVVA